MREKEREKERKKDGGEKKKKKLERRNIFNARLVDIGDVLLERPPLVRLGDGVVRRIRLFQFEMVGFGVRS